MRKFFAILILVCLGVLLFVNFSNTTSKDKFDKSTLTNADRLLKNLKDDYEGAIKEIRDLQKTPEQVINVNNTIMEKLYSHKITEDEVELLLKTQRELYDDEILKKNPVDVHFKRAKEEIESYKNTNTKIIGYDIQKDSSGNTEENVTIKVVYYLNMVGPQGQVYEEYLLVKDEELWKIKGWQKTDEFIIVGD